jgi:hypothetical protein
MVSGAAGAMGGARGAECRRRRGAGGGKWRPVPKQWHEEKDDTTPGSRTTAIAGPKLQPPTSY